MPTPILLLTGHPCAGKTTVGRRLRDELQAYGYQARCLDGDELRVPLRSFGFSAEERENNVVRFATVAALLSRHGVVPIISLVSPTEEIRQAAQEQAEKLGGGEWVTIYVGATQEVLDARAAERIAAGRPEFKGERVPYEVPVSAIKIDTSSSSVSDSVDTILRTLIGRHKIVVDPRAWYERHARGVFGELYSDGWSLPDGAWRVMSESIDEKTTVLELGAGASTCLIAAQRPFHHWVVDHDPEWLKKACDIARPFLDKNLLVAPSELTTDQWRAIDPTGQFDVALVDHGPKMATRLADIPRIWKSVRKGGKIFFDDCRDSTRYAKQVASAVKSLGGALFVDPRSGPPSRRLGVVVKP